MTREEALNAITAFVENYACGSDLDGLREAIEALKNQRPHGEWKADGTCSECGVYSSLNKETAYFCPNCGASMIPSNSEIVKSKSEICPCITCPTALDRCGCQQDLCSDYQEWKEGDEK